ncbi:AAA family ATPase [Streptomyces peucetius]|uniref:ATP-binding protein n=1 Tax=Streptomyces peucetius TaxID=1950 RepID=A0ABY6IBQ6_STRPE|nr:ATP-binding protein [Streptomyces peucetius]UYQ63382.1 ATP-binding protein [Streptomyces peucetius]
MQRRSRPGKPPHVFDRSPEWDGLAAFAERPLPHAMLGIVSGRRRMGKTYLLRALVEQYGGFYFGATAATETESLRQFAAALAEHVGSPVAFSFATWDDAVSYLFGLAAPRDGQMPLLVVIDEFPYLAKTAPELPSLIQREIDRFQVEESRMRLLLCGSAMSVMGGLLASTAPLRGRAQLELVVRPFGYRAAAEFWGVASSPALAAQLHAVVGGTPAYRRQFLADDVPGSPEEFDDWLCRTVLSPRSPLFREARYLLAEEADIRDTALYHSVLAAVAQGNSTRGGIAGYIGRKSVDISHPLNVLDDSHLLVREADVFRAGKSQYRITEPLINFYEAVMRPSWARLESGQAVDVWAQSAERFAAQVAGPHFEAMCREYVLGSGRALVGSALGQVGSGVVTDQAARRQIEIDVAVVEPGSGGSSSAVHLLGEAKWGTVMGLSHLERLARARELLAGRGLDTTGCALVCFSGVGFSEALRVDAARRGDVRLVGLDELYG